MAPSCLCNFSEVYPLGLTFRGLGLWNPWDYEVADTVFAAECSWLIGTFRQATSHFSEFWAPSTRVPLLSWLHSSSGLGIKQKQEDGTLESSSHSRSFSCMQRLLYLRRSRLLERGKRLNFTIKVDSYSLWMGLFHLVHWGFSINHDFLDN